MKGSDPDHKAVILNFSCLEKSKNIFERVQAIMYTAISYSLQSSMDVWKAQYYDRMSLYRIRLVRICRS